ncbi:MAG: hypothetical protein RHS_5672 [Robinsoniella sp. RHS]|nr:MAG: hypothetical protein RHS_5672 [Robinsoniella sp. RHS]
MDVWALGLVFFVGLMSNIVESRTLRNIKNVSRFFRSQVKPAGKSGIHFVLIGSFEKYRV